MVKIAVDIQAVDGETNYSIECSDVKLALEFLDNHDHEGAIVSTSITTYGTEAYKSLNELEKLK